MSFYSSSKNYVWITSDAFSLGSGASASVYQGVHKRTGEEVAVKAFKNWANNRPLELRMREFEVMKALSHENIVKLIAIEEEVRYSKKVLIMELCRGGNLQRILEDPENVNGLEEKEFLCVLKDLTAGLKYLRDCNYVHRDLKPANIVKYISEDGCSIYKLADFGSARYLEDDQEYQSMHGTEEYLHPDTYKIAVLRQEGEKTFRATADLWSIGATIYQLATGSVPFRPFGGRRNRVTMGYILSQKPSGVISGIQHEENRSIEWSTKLPETCLLNKGLKDLVNHLLAGILECNKQKAWTYDKFFESVMDILHRRIFHIFYMNEGKEITFYMQPHKTLQDLKDDISTCTKVPDSSQLLLFDKSCFSSQASPSPAVSTLPTTTLEQPLILIHMKNIDEKDLSALGAAIPFPAFSSSLISTDVDASVAQTCCIKAYEVKRLVVKIVRCQKLLLQIPEIRISLIAEIVTKLCSDSDFLKVKVEAVSYRSELLKKNALVVSQFLSGRPNFANGNHLSNSKIICDNIKVSIIMKNVDKVKKEFAKLLSSVHEMKQSVLISKSLQSECQQVLSECCSLDKCVERSNIYVEKIRDSWQVFIRHKCKRVLNDQDQNYHLLERLKMQNMNRKLSALLQADCLKAYLQALNKINDWFLGIQAFMVKCRCLGELLFSFRNDLDEFSSSLQIDESKLHEFTMQIIPSIKLPKDSSLNLNNSSHKKRGPVLNSNTGDNAKQEIFEKLQICQKGVQDLQKATKENNFLIKRLDSLLKNVCEDSTLNEGSKDSFC